MVCCSQKCPMANHKIQTTTMVNKPVANSVNTVRHTVPPSLNNLSTITFKAPVGTMVLPNCSTLLSSSKVDPKLQPVLVVPSPSNRSVDGPQTGVLLNLVPPIRVPQYPPPSSPRTPGPATCQRTPVVNNSSPMTVTSSSSSVVYSSHAKEQTSGHTTHNSVRYCGKQSPVHSTDKLNSERDDQKKKEFITALGLVTRDSLSDLKNKKLERKRRSTANPQFSNAALEEKWKNAAAAQAAAPPHKRPRGRPRLESKPVVCPTNGVCSSSDSPKMEPLSPPDDNITITSTSVSSSSSQNDSPTLVNGVHRQSSSSDEGKNVEQMLSGLCVVCTQPGDLVKCDTCATQQHLGCMQPPLIARPQGVWQCCDCQSRTVSLTVVQSYDVLKAAKEDEKRKLLKKSLELRLKRSQLEGRLLQLKELSGKQKNRQSEMQSSSKNVELLMDRFHSVINGVKMYS